MVKNKNDKGVVLLESGNYKKTTIINFYKDLNGAAMFIFNKKIYVVWWLYPECIFGFKDVSRANPEITFEQYEKWRKQK
jgi:hypothetical protein